LGHPHTEETSSGKWIAAVMHEDGGGWHKASVEQAILRGYFRSVI
jgi:hypothetical protein